MFAGRLCNARHIVHFDSNVTLKKFVHYGRIPRIQYASGVELCGIQVSFEYLACEAPKSPTL